MKSAVLREAGHPLVIEERSMPRLEAGEILIKVKACGVCHTDLHLAAGEWPLPKLPLILGHEAVGEVVEVGPGVANFRVGDRAGVPWIYSTCGTCEFCASDREPLCPAVVVTGFMVDGGYAEFLKAPAAYAVAAPPALTWADAAPLYCAGLTPYRALKISGARLGDTVVAWGVGGLGHYAIQIAKALGARVVAVDIAAAKLELARRLGADVTVNASEGKIRETFKSLGGAHVVLCLAPTAEAIGQAFEALRRGGTLVLVGMPSAAFTLPIRACVAKGVQILTSAVGTRQDLREVLSLAAAGKVKTIAETCRLEQINQVFDRMRNGEIVGRVVVQFD